MQEGKGSGAVCPKSSEKDEAGSGALGSERGSEIALRSEREHFILLDLLVQKRQSAAGPCNIYEVHPTDALRRSRATSHAPRVTRHESRATSHVARVTWPEVDPTQCKDLVAHRHRWQRRDIMRQAAP